MEMPITLKHGKGGFVSLIGEMQTKIQQDMMFQLSEIQEFDITGL